MRPNDDALTAKGAERLNKTNSIRKLNINDPDLNQTYFLMLDHPPSRANSGRFNSLTNALKSQMYDGINNIGGLTRIRSQVDHRSFTYLQIDVV